MLETNSSSSLSHAARTFNIASGLASSFQNFSLPLQVAASAIEYAPQMFRFVVSFGRWTNSTHLFADLG